MKKLILSLVICLMAAFSANAQDWRLGGRVGAGFQLQAEYGMSGDSYLEGRFGMSFLNGLDADFTALHMWNVATMNWTPSAGEWFFDAGTGLGVGGRAHFAYVGVAGSAKLGIEFSGAPVRLSLDWTPVIGPGIGYGGGHSSAGFNAMGLANIAVSAVYCF